ncbi:MAG TPA: peptidylprolyl isomerase [Gemmatimonadales bacterium]|nr:peptidylprolyl isomerase [Gemmatimonadales bacterium]
MDAFRGSKKIAAVIFTVLMLLFVLTSVDYSKFTGADSVGKINGDKVSLRTYQAAVQQQLDQQRRAAPGQLGLEETQQVRDQVWEGMIQDKVLEDEYARRGIAATDDEVVEAMRNDPPPEVLRTPEFQTNGRFDLAKYQRWLASAAAAPLVPVLEAQARENIRRGKLFRLVAADVYVSDAALWEHYRDQHETVKIGLTPIIPRMAVADSAVSVTPAEVEQYYQQHKRDFERPKTAYLSYVALPRVITAQDTAAARQHAEELRQEIAGGAPFADVAKRESADTVSGNRGGDLGWWKRGQMDPSFDSAAFALPLNTVSQPVLSSFGFHLIEVTARKGDSAQARHILVPIELSGANRDRLDAQADTLDKLAAEQMDPAALDTAAKALHLKVGKALPVQKGTRVQVGPLVVPDAGVWAFQAKKGEISPIIETSNALFVFRLDSVQAAGIPPLSAIRPEVELSVRDQKKFAAAREKGQEYLKRLSEGASMADAAKAMNLPYREFGPFTRTEPPLPNPALVGAAFSLPKGAHSDLIDTKEGLYVLQVVEHTPADSAEFAKKLDDLRVQGIQAARQDRVRAFLTSLRKQAKVVDRRDAVLGTEAQSRTASGI